MLPNSPVLFMVLFMIGCKANVNDEDAPVIQSITVLSSSEKDGVAIIDPYVSGGSFNILAKLHGIDFGFYYRLTYDADKQHMLAEGQCSGVEACSNNAHFLLSCRYSLDGHVYCGQQKTPVTIPSSTFGRLSLTICDFAQVACIVQSEDVFIR